MTARRSLVGRVDAFATVRLRRLALHAMGSAEKDGFARAINRYCRLARRKTRFGYDHDKAAYFYTDADAPGPVWFKHKSRALMYLDGYAARLAQLRAEYLFDQVPVSPGDLIVDCGANIGEFGLLLRGAQPAARYLAVEPSPEEFAALGLNCPEAEAEALACGLWSEEGSLDFYIASETADSSLIPPPDYQEVITVPVRRLDDIITGPVRLLKLEAEGAEPEILEGAGEALRLIDYVAADVGFERGMRQESTLAPVANHLIAAGFEMVELAHPRLVALFRRKGVT